MEIRDESFFAREAEWYIDHIGAVRQGLDHENKKTVLRQLYKILKGNDRKLLPAAFRRLEEKLVA